MSWLIIISGIFALLTTIGHFAVGSKQFLAPMLRADFDPVAKKVMHSVFHYVSVFLILSSVVLLAVGAGFMPMAGAMLLVQFIAVAYGLFAVWQIFIALTSDIPNAPFKLFQWVFFLLISGFALIGSWPA